MSSLYQAIDYTSDTLVQSVKDAIIVPNSQNLFTAPVILRYCNREMANTIVPLIMSAKAYYLIEHFDYTITSDTDYVIPDIAQGMKLMDVCYVSAQGIENKMPLLTHDQVASNQWTINMVSGFFVHNNTVKIYPFGLQGFILRLYFYRRPNQIVETSKAGQVTEIAGNVLTLTRVPPAWVVDDNVCAISQLPGFDQRFNSQSIVDITYPTITIEDATDVQLGDWICLENESTIPQIMPEGHGLLAQAAALKMLLGVASPQAQLAGEIYGVMREEFIKMITPRTDDAPKKIRNINSALNWSRIRNKWSWW